MQGLRLLQVWNCPSPTLLFFDTLDAKMVLLGKGPPPHTYAVPLAVKALKLSRSPVRAMVGNKPGRGRVLALLEDLDVSLQPASQPASRPASQPQSNANSPPWLLNALGPGRPPKLYPASMPCSGCV
jgi:hypothetical protein